MTDRHPHITVCICTYKRLRYLERLLEELANQATAGRFTYSILVVDNDSYRSAEPIVKEFRRKSSIAAAYAVQPEQSIALTRNTAVENAQGEFLVFIDDDEYPIRDWLLILFQTLQDHRVDGVLGPVKPHYEQSPPGWVLKGAFYDRPSYPTGHRIDWRQGRTGNVLLARHVFWGEGQPFRPEFLTGEDQDFFRRMIAKGYVFVWCNEALAYEFVPAARWNRSFMLKRALLRGKISLAHPTSGTVEILKSMAAVPLYALALPFLLLAGQHLFMKYLVKTFDHAGRLLAFAGIDPIKQKYVTE